MAESNLRRMEVALRKQQMALAELIDIALLAVRESSDASVATIHLQTRLQALAESLQPSTPAVRASDHPNPGNHVS